MITLLSTMQTVMEALACADAGADHLGVTPLRDGLAGEVPLRLVAEIVEAIGHRAQIVVRTVWTDPVAIGELADATKPAILHLSPPAHLTTPGLVEQTRVRLPGVPIMQSIQVTGPESVSEARAFAEVADYLVLETPDSSTNRGGATGAVHDWQVSHEIVRAVHVPVVLAGGLSPDNVAEAIRIVRPWGVASQTQTNLRLTGGGFRKDLDRVRAFVAAAHAALGDDADLRADPD